jgi:hypothetical protein
MPPKTRPFDFDTVKRPTSMQATTGEVPLVSLDLERERLQPMPTPWPGLIQPARVN